MPELSMKAALGWSTGSTHWALDESSSGACMKRLGTCCMDAVMGEGSCRQCMNAL